MRPAASCAGLGLLDVVSAKGSGRRAVGELLAEVLPAGPRAADGLVLPALNGFENHGGVTTVGSGSTPLARVIRGVGNGDGSGTEGAWSGRILGTYLHGPLLARNTALADVLLGWALERTWRACPPPAARRRRGVGACTRNGCGRRRRTAGPASSIGLLRR